MDKRYALTLAALVIALTCFTFPTSRPTIAASGRTTIFKPILPALHRTGVPVILPTLPGLNRFHATILARSKGHYDIMLGYVPNCQGDACEYGELLADRHPRTTPHAPGRPVTLPGHATGYYVNFSCGASCGSSTVTVDVGGYRYVYGIKVGKKSAVVQMAASALRAGPQ